MPDFRSYAGDIAPEAESLHLSPEESHHLVAVNRAREGNEVVAFDGRGQEWHCRLAQADKRTAQLRVISTRSHPLPLFQLALVQAIPKGKGFESIARRATEIGATQLFPIITERVEFKLKSEKEGVKESRWRNATVEGAKQCGNPWLPTIAPVMTLAAMLDQHVDTFDLRIACRLDSERLSIHETFAQEAARPRSVLFVVGPEGDFSPEEYQLLENTGFKPVTLGPYVLRSETAAVAALSLVRQELGY